MGSGGESPADYLQRASVPSPALSSRGLAACRGAALLEPLLIVAFATWQQQASSRRSVASPSVSLPACLAAGLSPGLGHGSGDRQSPAAARREPALCLLLEAQMLFRSWMRAGVQRSQKKGVPSALGGGSRVRERRVLVFLGVQHSATCSLLPEPAILVMHHSMKPHPAITATLLDFMCRVSPPPPRSQGSSLGRQMSCVTRVEWWWL